MVSEPRSSLSPSLSAILASWKEKAAIPIEDVQFAYDADANRLVKANTTAFLMAAAIDRGGDSYKLWAIPHMLAQHWGHLDTARIRYMDTADLVALPAIATAPSMIGRRDLARTIRSMAEVIEKDYGGDAEALFDGDAADVMSRLQRIHGVGPNIARMIVIQRQLYFGWQPHSGDRILPKMDVHVMRVFARAGLSQDGSDRSVAAALSGLSIKEVGIVDQVVWDIGKKWCRPTSPVCSACILVAVCPKVGL